MRWPHKNIRHRKVGKLEDIVEGCLFIVALLLYAVWFLILVYALAICYTKGW